MKIALQKLLLIFACISPFIPISALQAQTDSLGALYQRNFMQQRAKYPQEQAVLLTDKPCYYVGDSVRYRVHLLNRGLGRTDSLSRNFYIELRDRGGNFISGQMLDLFSPVQFGAMPLPDTLITGNYLLIAYTLWMRNFSDRAVTVLPIFVRHRAPDTLLRSKIAHLKGEVKAFDRLAKKLRINWGSDDFPTLRLRSGFWVSVRNLQDKAVPAVLSLYEGKALVQTTIANGYGLAFVRYNTKADTKYKLVATYRNWKKTAKWKSPKAAGYSTDMLVNDGKLSLYFRNEGMPTADRVARTKHIVLQANGKLVQWQTTVADTVVISLTNLPYSSLKCSVLGGAGQVIGEWPVYNSAAKSLGFSLKRELTSESLALRIATTGGEKQAQEFTLSIRAKTEADKLAPKVWVVNPLKSVHDLAPDSVMLVREMLASSADLSWPELFSGQKIALRYPHEKAIEISGQIVKTYLNLPYPGVRVMLSNLLSHNQNYETISGLGGRFRFSNLYFADSAHIYIEVLSDRDNHVGLVNIDTLSNVSTG
ncbi:MAG: hypothetical protein RIS47_2356, partial [Bacteroidota bacterium]